MGAGAPSPLSATTACLRGHPLLLADVVDARLACACPVRVEPHVGPNAGREVVAVLGAERSDQGIATLLRDLAVDVTVPAVETWLLCQRILPPSEW